jgi:hypothetical protein
MFMVMLVIDDPHHLDAVLDAWEAIGINGATIIESTGINRRRRAHLVGATFMSGINRLTESDDEGHYTLFAIVPSMEVAAGSLSAVERITGSLDKPDTGVFAAWSLELVKGVQTAG